jgi:imidazole glycerol phosphate synthase glutamine amidotransferase subunit
VNDVLVVNYGAGNTRSVLAALRHCDVAARVSENPDEISRAPFVILPGVGAAKQAMAHLDQTGVAEALRTRHHNDRPLLGICLGLQIALEYSDEDGGVTGLGLAPGSVHRIQAERVPRLGWALVEPWDEAYYFAHSYVATSPLSVATSDGETAAVRAGSFLGVQFHPEKSGPAGLNFLRRCLSNA